MSPQSLLIPAIRFIVCFTMLLIDSRPWLRADEEVREVQTQLLIVGGTESGWAAALQAARMGVESITIVHDGRWLGGQYTEQALACVDENKGVGRVGWGVDWHPMKRSFHRSGLFKELMDEIEAHNTSKYGSPMPGRPYHGPSTFRPVEAEAVFRKLLQPEIAAGRVRLILNHYPVRADVDRSGNRPRLTGLWFAPLDASTADLHVQAPITIDASDWGEAIQVAGAAFECGPDPKTRYGEPSAPSDLSNNPPNEMNPITWPMIIVESAVETPIAEPARFDDRNFPRATRIGLALMKQLEWDHPRPGLGAIDHWPPAGQASPRQLSVYTVRRLVDGFQSPTGQTIILLNYMNGQDYPLERLPQHVVDELEQTEPGASEKNIVRMTRSQREIVFRDAKRHALSLLYHMQSFVHERAPDKTNSFRRFALSTEFKTADQLPPKPYIRESLRLRAMYMMREQDGRNRDGLTKEFATERFAHVMYPDGVFTWQFHYDFHRTGRTYLKSEGAAGPWIDFHKPNRHTSFVSDRSVFPLRSLIPEAYDGLLGAQKNLGYSSIVSAAIRLHDQCVAVGQAAGATAAVALKTNTPPREIPFQRELLESIRDGLCSRDQGGVPLLLWPYRDLDPRHPAFVAINRLAARSCIPFKATAVDFQPDEPAESEWAEQVVSLTHRTTRIPAGTQPPEHEGLTRGEFCRRWWQAIEDLPTRPFVRKTREDADGDSIPDADDALPFTPNKPIVFSISHTAGDEGLPPAAGDSGTILINFCGKNSAAEQGVSDHGAVFDAARGYGWTRDLTASHRRRRQLPELVRDTFLFTRTRDRWEYALPPGRYRVRVCVGDSAYPQTAQSARIEGRPIIDQISTAPGRFQVAEADVEIDDGRLTLDIGSGKPNSNTCVNWIQIERLPRNPSESR